MRPSFRVTKSPSEFRGLGPDGGRFRTARGASAAGAEAVMLASSAMRRARFIALLYHGRLARAGIGGSDEGRETRTGEAPVIRRLPRGGSVDLRQLRRADRPRVE